MPDIVILCVEDEPEVCEALLRDLEPYAGAFRIEAAQDAAEAQRVVDSLLAAGQHLGLVLCDHVLPGDTGVEFLVRLNQRAETAAARKVLVTGQAGLHDTVRAVNQANLDRYIAKPWTAAELHEVVTEQLTGYVIDHAEDLLPYVNVLDGPRLLEALAGRESRE